MKKSMLQKASLAAVATSLALGHSANATVIFQDDFDTGETVGSAPVDANWVEVSGDFIVRDSTTIAPFGSDNQYLETSGRDGGNGFSFNRNDAPTGTLITASFDFNWDNANTDSYMRWTLRGDAAVNGDRPLSRIDVGGGANDISVGAEDLGGAVISAGTAYRFDLVYNFTNAATGTYNGTNTVAANAVDVWINGVLALDDSAFDLTNGGTSNIPKNTQIADLGFWAQAGTNANLGNFYFDDYVLDDSAVVTGVPEPGTLALVGLGLFGLISRRRP